MKKLKGRGCGHHGSLSRGLLLPRLPVSPAFLCAFSYPSGGGSGGPLGRGVICPLPSPLLFQFTSLEPCLLILKSIIWKKGGRKPQLNINCVFLFMFLLSIIILLGNVQACDCLRESEQRKKNIKNDL